MAAPPNEYSYDIDAVERAGQHWRARAEVRQENRELLDQKRYTEVESKERLALRANRLLQKVKTTVARRKTMETAPEGLSEDLNELVKLGPIDEEDVTNDLMERVIGETRDFLSIEFLEKGLKVNRAVGRIVTNIGNGRRSFGTGFMVSPRLLLTNWHVLKTNDRAAASTVEFDYQLDCMGKPLTPQRFRLEPATFFLNNPELDFALVAVEETSSQNKKLRDFGWCQLIKEEGKAILGNPVDIIQHPLGEMKQVIIRENKLVDLPPKPLDTFAHYEGDTEPGSSGSPVFNDQWEVIALHHSGVPKTDKNGNMLDVDGRLWKKGDDPSRLNWIANEGIRISRIMNFIEKATVKPHEEALRAQLMAPGVSPVPISSKPPQEKEDTMEDQDHNQKVHSDVSGGAVTVTVPLNVTISLGSPAGASVKPATVVATEPDEDLLEKITPDKNYDERPGYDPNFLGFSVPMPKLGPSIRDLAVKLNNGDGNELKYHHYSVIMRGDRRLAFVSAVNLEGNAKINHPRDKNGDRWFFDPRIPEENQAGEELYKGNPLDRGHLVRRADAAWGSTKKEAKLANDDTFHFTNCSPQHEVYNQSTKANKKGVLLWGNIEEHIASQSEEGEGQRLAVFNGPIFRANDRKHRGVGIPREFWKVVVAKTDDGKPKALAFILSQASLIKNLPAEEFEVGPYQPFQVRIRDLESKTKLDFGNLKDHDPLEDEENESFFESGTEIVPIESLKNIVY